MGNEAGAERPSYVAGEDLKQVLEQERKFLGVQDVGQGPPALCGLCLSGGGIRSAAFNTGVLQALVAHDQLHKFDYLSTVSGGGYIGAALTWWLHRGLPTARETEADTHAENFPFGARPRTDGKSEWNEQEQAQNHILDYLRHRASYLNPTPQLNMGSFVAVVLRATAVSLFVYFTLLTGLLGLLICWGLLNTRAAWHDWSEGSVWEAALEPLLQFQNIFACLAVACFAFLFLGALVYSLWSRLPFAPLKYEARTVIQGQVGRVSSIGLASFALGILPALRDFLENYQPWRALFGLQATSGGSSVVILYAAISTIAGALLGAQEGNAQLSGSSVAKFISRVRAPLAVVLVAYGLLLGSYSMAYWLHEQEGAAGLWGSGHGAPFAVILVAGLIFGWFSNINYVGLHRTYRDRLMEFFLPNFAAVRYGRWELATEADRVGIHQVGRDISGQAKRPYHLINANVVLVDSQVAKYRARGGDGFILSPLYCGSEATGYRRSDEYMNAQSGRGMSLASAMAISGAAVNPHTGVSGRGLTRNRIVSMLLTLLNLRLGYWAPHPKRRRSAIPNFLNPALVAGFAARGLHERGRIVELTDGGHYENLGVYELLRRRVATIVVSDAGADPLYEFSDLANLVERARADFGAKIYFPNDDGLCALLPDEKLIRDLRLQVAERGYAVGKIRYLGDSREAPSGSIVYLKTTMIPGLPADVLGYKLANPAFPDESTGDQFFSEPQFEAYRELGYRIGEQWLEAEGGLPGAPREAQV